MIREAITDDGLSIGMITKNAGVFTQEEVDCVEELWDEYVKNGSLASGYYFVVDQKNSVLRGYACYGPRSLTEGTYDLYWIAVDLNYRREGVGRQLLDWVENDIRQLGGRLVVVETSGLDKYYPTRRFYLANGYSQDGIVKDFYADGDDLVLFSKHL